MNLPRLLFFIILQVFLEKFHDCLFIEPLELRQQPRGSFVSFLQQFKGKVVTGFFPPAYILHNRGEVRNPGIRRENRWIDLKQLKDQNCTGYLQCYLFLLT